MKFHSLPDSEGRITQMMVLDLQNKSVPNSELLRRYASLLRAFEQPIDFFILTNAMMRVPARQHKERRFERAPFVQSFLHGRHKIHRLELLQNSTFLKPALDRFFGQGKYVLRDRGFHSHSTWAQDPVCVIRNSHGDPVLVDPWYSKQNFDYQLLGKALASQSDLVLKPTHLYLQGGNILQGQDFILVGEDAVAENMNAHQMGRETVLLQLKELFGVGQVVVVGDGRRYVRKPHFFQGDRQPVFHLDMYMSLGGRVKEGGKEKELVFVGEQKLVGRPGRGEEKPLRMIAEGLDAAADQLRGAQLGGRSVKVARMPLPMLLRSSDPLGLRRSSYASLNNCLMERAARGKRVLLPRYVLGRGQNKAIQDWINEGLAIYKREGFETVAVDGPWGNFTRLGGSLHCMVKVLARSS